MMNDRAVPASLAAATVKYAPEELCSVVEQSFCAMDYLAAPEVQHPLTSFDGIGFGEISVFRHSSVGQRIGIRQPGHVDRRWIDDFIISIPLDAHLVTRQGGHEAQLDPGSFSFLSTLKPFHTSLAGASPQAICSSFVVRVSAPVLRERAPPLDNFCGLPLEIKGGAGKIMYSLFELALDEGKALSPRQRRGFSDMLLNAITNVALEVIEEHGAPRVRQSSLDRVRNEAIAYIRRNLSNPELHPGEVAQYCHVSERYLQSAFASAQKTVSAYIRDERLLQCQAALRNSAMNRVSIIEIAMNWGFNDAPYFCRAYKALFGRSPSAERKN